MKARKHGQARVGHETPEYIVWKAMKQRCLNPNNRSYGRYGAIGVTVCKRWLRFENFIADMGPRPAGLTLERRVNRRGYSPNNCKWATTIEQSRNRRPNWNYKLNARKAARIRKMYDSGDFTQAELAEQFGVAQSNINKILTGKSYQR